MSKKRNDKESTICLTRNQAKFSLSIVYKAKNFFFTEKEFFKEKEE